MRLLISKSKGSIPADVKIFITFTLPLFFHFLTLSVLLSTVFSLGHAKFSFAFVFMNKFTGFFFLNKNSRFEWFSSDAFLTFCFLDKPINILIDLVFSNFLMLIFCCGAFVSFFVG